MNWHMFHFSINDAPVWINLAVMEYIQSDSQSGGTIIGNVRNGTAIHVKEPLLTVTQFLKS